MDAREREYAGFGPWAIEISDEDPPPPLFASYLTRSETPLLSVKIPRHLERRQARPGMDLYDHLVSLYEDDLVLLQRVDHDVRFDTYPIRDVQHLRVTSCLLLGAIHLALPGRTCTLRYNTISERLMLRLVALIRQRYTPEPALPPAEWEIDVPPGLLSFRFQHLLDAQRRRGTGMHLVAAQGTMPVASGITSPLRRSLLRVADKRLSEAMHSSDGRELKIITRGKPYRYRWEVEYGLETTYIPVRNLTSVLWQADVTNAATDLILRTHGEDSVYPFDQANVTIDRYADYLSGVPEAVAPAAGRPAA